MTEACQGEEGGLTLSAKESKILLKSIMVSLLSSSVALPWALDPDCP
jgi:hypothetical protein